MCVCVCACLGVQCMPIFFFNCFFFAQEWRAIQAKFTAMRVVAPKAPSATVTVGQIIENFKLAVGTYGRHYKPPVDPTRVIDNHAPQAPLASRAAVTIEARGRVPPTDKIIRLAVGSVPC